MTDPGETCAPIAGCCNSCRHYDAAFGAANYGNCRRWPPIAVERHANGLPRGVWPVVGYDDRCGEHAPAAG
jgi:hypothetical protein